MFASASSAADETLEGCPVVHLTDSEDDLAHLVLRILLPTSPSWCVFRCELSTFMFLYINIYVAIVPPTLWSCTPSTRSRCRPPTSSPSRIKRCVLVCERLRRPPWFSEISYIDRLRPLYGHREPRPSHRNQAGAAPSSLTVLLPRE